MEEGGIQIVTRTLMKDQELLFSSDMLLKIKTVCLIDFIPKTLNF